MSNRNHGGPAFPHTFQTLAAPLGGDPMKLQPAEPVTVVLHGMTVRDYFVAHSCLTLADAKAHWFDVNGRYGTDKPTLAVLLDLLAQMRGMEADSLVAERAA